MPVAGKMVTMQSKRMVTANHDDICKRLALHAGSDKWNEKKV
jgi:hypothetical protein